ncbi:PleD family two-component system response regulator [Mucilaginibacter sp. UR6-11]|uniref:response regulator n=1 Tax=Mucilaginibacter sp. UR6-11 TaxID=1435644 RepID=UPI001E610506|nr:response regulator [Mucilaginibacter sp. UR6-11]MCC8424519.1 response regulator [Mucilaginibacter sp. UR6-11]
MSKKILIVDDNEFMIEVMTYILNNKGYDVIALNNGDQVLDRIKTASPDLVILDMMLPDADGREICHEIKHNTDTRDLPVIICTGSNDVKLSMNQPGSPDDILYKPFNVDSLVDMVAYQLAA